MGHEPLFWPERSGAQGAAAWELVRQHPPSGAQGNHGAPVLTRVGLAGDGGQASGQVGQSGATHIGSLKWSCIHNHMDNIVYGCSLGVQI